MSTGKQGSSAVTITLDDGSGTPRTITNGVLSMSALEIEAMLQATHAYGDSFEESSPTGMGKVTPVTLTGFFDDTPTTGTHAVMQINANDRDPNGTSRTLAIVVGPNSGDTFTVETRMQKYGVLGKNGNLTEFTCLLQPTGSAVWT